MSEARLLADEERLLGMLFSLVTSLGYRAGGEARLSQGRSVEYQKVCPVRRGIFKLVVFRTEGAGMGSTTFVINFDPSDKEGLIFGKFLLGVEVKLLAVFGDGGGKRECVMEVRLKDPVTRWEEDKYYYLAADKVTKARLVGKKWLGERMTLKLEEALVVAEAMVNCAREKGELDV